MGKVSTLVHLPPEVGWQEYSFLNKTVEECDHGPESICKDALNTPELSVSFDEPHGIASVSLGFLCSVRTPSDSCTPWLASSIKSCTFRCHARALPLPVSLAGRMLALKLIPYFLSHPAAFGFLAATLLDNMMLNAANKQTN